MTYDKIFEDMEKELKEKNPSFDPALLQTYDFTLPDLDDDETEAPPKREIPKGKFRPLVCYAETEEGSCIVNNFIVACTDKETESEFIAVIYDQNLGKQGIYKYI